MKIILLITAIAFSATSAYAGPFGIEMGQPLKELDVADDSLHPILNSVPKPHPTFIEYGVWASKKTGVCRIIAISETFSNDSYGTKIRSSMDDLAAALSKKYGNAEKIDVIRDGALWHESSDWVMSIRQNERVYGYTWDILGNSVDPKISSIEISVSAASSSVSFYSIRYRSNKFEECYAAIEAKKNDNL